MGRREPDQADATLAALSRQLVQAKMAEADAQRKHRCTAICCLAYSIRHQLTASVLLNKDLASLRRLAATDTADWDERSAQAQAVHTACPAMPALCCCLLCWHVHAQQAGTAFVEALPCVLSEYPCMALG